MFLSVDLVGSTAFKAKSGEKREPNEPYPIWLNRTKNFYRLFPQMLIGNFDDFLSVIDGSDSFKNFPPQVWKTVGDEIIFCVRLVCLEHLAACMRAFMKTLANYGASIHSIEAELDVKGCAWIASFPAPNVTTVSASRLTTDRPTKEVGSQLYEEDERQADIRPGDYDFLGKQIDTGFRIAKFAQPHELSLSIDLAWLLALLKQRDLIDCQFMFRGRESLKGVISGVPYPIITIHTERSVKRRELHSLEQSVTGAEFAEPIRLRNYLYSFMEQHDLDIPIISMHNEKYDSGKLPQCYLDLQRAWSAGQLEADERSKNKEEADAFNDDTMSSPENDDTILRISSLIDEIIERMVRNEKED